jgi:hypothetical protein
MLSNNKLIYFKKLNKRMRGGSTGDNWDLVKCNVFLFLNTLAQHSDDHCNY